MFLCDVPYRHTAIEATANVMGQRRGRLRAYAEEQFHYDLSPQLDDIRPTYSYDMSCQNTVPQALLAFLEGANFEDVIRIAVSLGGDSDTIAAMAGSIAQAFYGLPQNLASYCYSLLTPYLRTILNKFEESIGSADSRSFRH